MTNASFDLARRVECSLPSGSGVRSKRRFLRYSVNGMAARGHTLASKDRQQPKGLEADRQQSGATYGLAERGRATIKVAPGPARDCTEMSPLWARINPPQM